MDAGIPVVVAVVAVTAIVGNTTDSMTDGGGGGDDGRGDNSASDNISPSLPDSSTSRKRFGGIGSGNLDTATTVPVL